MKEKVLPAVSQAYKHRAGRRSSAYCIELQVDGAPLHVGGGNINKLNAIGAALRPPVKVVQQPAQSPDVNVCDLTLYAMWASWVGKINGGNNIADQLAAAVDQAWAATASDDVDKAFRLLDVTYQSIADVGGFTNYKKPHTAPRTTPRH
eukprot:m.511733 g.511733  ORF g.511733 m.511733 type:complete len:149 (-) comp103027_c0_seq1:185-631(-)